MDHMDGMRERIEALEQQTKAMAAHTGTVERRLRWWRGIACGVVMLSLLSLALPLGKAADAPGRSMAERMATVERTLSTMAFDAAANEVVISGANLRIVNGLGATDTTNGLGNLIVGYNELRESAQNTRTGSHNVVVGRAHDFSSFGGLVVGDYNSISGPFASVSGGLNSQASGEYASVSGGTNGAATARYASVSGGINNLATAFGAWAGGGAANRATGDQAAVSGGIGNTASGVSSSVSGGRDNTASGAFSSVSGGENNTASGDFPARASSVSGGFWNTASGDRSSVSGGQNNTASGDESSVSGGLNRTAPAQFNWAAGALFSDM